MKKNVLIWGIALILVVAAVYINTNFNNTPFNKNNGKNSDQINLNTDLGKAMDFKLQDLEGNTVYLSDYEGKNVYVNFFATWCPPCKAEMPDLEKLWEKYQDKDLVVLAIDLGDDQEEVRSFIEENKFTFKTLLDSDLMVSNQYNVTSIPVSVFIDKQGNIVAKQVGAMSFDQMESYVKQLMDKQ